MRSYAKIHHAHAQCNERTQINMVDVFWPDFGLRDFVPILLQYQRKVWGQHRSAAIVA